MIGSTINKGCSPKADANIQKRHKEYITQYAKETNGIIEVIKEKEFESPSGASTVCCGYSSNAWIDWHDKNGVQIKKYKKDINN